MQWDSIRTVVVPVDLEAPQKEALATAVGAVAPNGEVHVVYVLKPMEPALMLQIPEARRIASARENLQSWIAALDQRPASHTIHVAVGDPAQEVVAYAASVGADLIVLPSHKRRGLVRAFVGSVANRIVRLAEMPVVVL